MDALTDSKEILSNVKQLLRLSNNDHDIWLKSLVQQRSRDLNTNETVAIKHCVVFSQNNKFYLPENCKKIIAFRDKSSCIPGIFLDLPFFKSCNCNVLNINPLVRILDINGRWANFIGVVPDGTEIEIAYWIVDDDINEEAYTAISNYVAYQFALSYPENYTPEQRRDWRTDGVYQGARVRGAAARRKFEQDKIQIRNLMTMMVNGQAPISALQGSYVSFLYPTIR